VCTTRFWNNIHQVLSKFCSRNASSALNKISTTFFYEFSSHCMIYIVSAMQCFATCWVPLRFPMLPPVRCYTFVNERLTWNAAEYKCASLSSMKSTMTTVRSKEHFNFLIKLASKKSFWIGKFSMRSITCILLSACDTGTSSLPPDDQCLYHKVKTFR
jgi:hypothetical protein